MTRLGAIRPGSGVPPEAPMPFPAQDLAAPFSDTAAPEGTPCPSRWAWRAGVFLPTLLATGLIIALFTDFFAIGGLSPFETVLISMIAFTFFWIAMSLFMAVSGLVRVLLTRRREGVAAPIDVALVIPIHNEVPNVVFGNALAMLEDLAEHSARHRYALFILSDTRDEEVVAGETLAFSNLQIMAPPTIPVSYRRFPENAEKKIGNLGEWIRRWGGAYEGMVVLDADSLMSADAIERLADALSEDPEAGLFQSTPAIIGSKTVFGRIQQFATAAYGPLLSAGLAAWTGREGNYWGHNAIVRTRAFAACAGLPRIGRGQ
ncbi:MAG: glucans biosynthesis glucosyltransferase MdoH, partial [Pseudomonadota bacterium]